MIDDETLMIRETAERLFADHCERAVIELAGAGTWPENLWTQVEETGLTLALVSEDFGGAGLDGKSALDRKSDVWGTSVSRRYEFAACQHLKKNKHTCSL